METQLPNFLIIGAARCGTTALYNILRKHPDISMPALKEPRYFSSRQLEFPHNGPGDHTIDQAVIRKENDYKKLFTKVGGKRIGEASPDYLFFHEFTAGNIYNYLGDVEIIILLRNPVERAYSAYNHLLRDNREKLSFEDALEMEYQRKKDNYDFMWLYKEVGLYYEQVKTFKERFSNVHVLLQEDLKRQPEHEINRITEFLSISNNFQYDSSVNYNSAGEPSNFVAKFILDRNNSI